MVTRPISRLLLLIILAVCLVACGKKTEPAEKSAGQLKSEREASAAKARESPVFGDQLKAMDKAKATADEAAKVADDRLKKADQ